MTRVDRPKKKIDGQAMKTFYVEAPDQEFWSHAELEAKYGGKVVGVRCKRCLEECDGFDYPYCPVKECGGEWEIKIQKVSEDLSK